MRTVRSAVMGLVLVTTVSLAGAGCGIGGRSPDSPVPRGESSPSRQLSPTEKLADAAAKTNSRVYDVTMRAPGVTTSARVDPAGRKATMSMFLWVTENKTRRIDLILVDADLYLRLPDPAGQSRKWMRLDRRNLPEGSPFNLMPEGDATGAADLVNCVVTARRVGGRTFPGTLDLGRSRTVDRKVIAELGPRAAAVPFTAQTGIGGDLLEFTIDIPSLLPTHGEIRFVYGASRDPVDAARPPASEVTEASPAMVDSLEV